MDISALSSNAASAAPSSSAFSQLTNNFDTFLTLLTTQLQNQNPLEPLDTEKFTEQLVQFASVEQSIKTNSNLEALISLQSTSERDSAIGFVGKAISIENTVASNNGDGAKWTYTLPQSVDTATITIANSAGDIIARRSGATAAGDHEVNWNGLSDDGSAAPAGDYLLSIDARRADGNIAAATIQSVSTVSGVIFGPDGPRLQTPTGLVTLDAVKSVFASK